MRSPVEDEVMNIHQQIDMLWCRHYLKAIECIVGKVEGTHEFIFVCRQPLLAHLSDGHLHRTDIIQALYKPRFIITEMNSQLWMLPDECLYSLNQRVGVCRRGKRNLRWDIVERCRRILQTVKINTRLSVTQRITGDG